MDTQPIEDYVNEHYRYASDLLRKVRKTPNDQDIDASDCEKLLADEFHMLRCLLDEIERLQADNKALREAVERVEKLPTQTADVVWHKNEGNTFSGGHGKAEVVLKRDLQAALKGEPK